MGDNSSPTTPTASGGRLRNLIVAAVAIALSVAIALGIQGKGGTDSLAVQAENSVPLTVALSNGKPTLTEFYADWCTTCQTMAGEMAQLKTQFGDGVNFVMLNVDNSKWIPEVLRYGVDGIPHFVFQDASGEAIAEVIGELPQPIFEANLQALVVGESIPYAYATGKMSQFNSLNTPAASPQNDPRSHGAQVNAEVQS